MTEPRAVFGPEARYGVNSTFSPALAASVLVDLFDRVAWHRYHDTLHVTDLEDVIAFATSTPPASDATPAQLDELRALVQDQMRDGVFVVSKDTGALICGGPLRT